MATAILDATNRPGARRPTADDVRALDALSYAVDAGPRIVLLEGSNPFRRSALLLEVARRVEPARRPLLASGDSSRPQGGLIEQIHSMAGLPSATDPDSALALFLERSAVAGRPVVVLVDEAHKFSSRVLRDLIRLIEHAEGRASAVFAVPDRQMLLGALKGVATFVDLIRLRGRTEERRPLDPRGPVHRPGFEAPRPDESRDRVHDTPRPGLSEMPTGPAEFETVTPDPDDRLSTIEELLGDAGRVGSACERVETLSSAPPAGVNDLSRRGAGGNDSLGTAPLTAVDVEVVDRATSTAGNELMNAGTGVAPAGSGLSDEPAVGSDPERSVQHRPGLSLALAALATAILGLSLVVVDRFSHPSPDRWVEPNPPGSASASGPDSKPVDSGMEIPSDESGSETTASSIGDSVLPVASLSDALDALATDHPSAERDDAIRFLLDHGPDAEAYEFLAELGSRPAGSPRDVAQNLAAQSRLRRVLCSVWADDPRGEAPIRLACPAAGSNLR